MIKPEINKVFKWNGKERTEEKQYDLTAWEFSIGSFSFRFTGYWFKTYYE